MGRYGRDYDGSFGGRAPRDGWGRGSATPGRRYDEDLFRRYAEEARGRSMRHQHAGGWMRGYDRGHSYGYGRGGLYGASMYGDGRYGGDYLGAWTPGGWSAEHGREHVGLRDADRFGRDFRSFRGARRFSDEAPTG